MALTQAAAMTGGKSYTLKTTSPFSDKTKKVKLCLYVKTSKDAANRKNTLTLGLYVTTPADWNIGKWTDYGGSSLAGNSFDGAIPNFSGTWWLVSGITKTVSYNSLGEATVDIPWSWGVNSTWGGMVKPSGTKSITLSEIAPKTYKVTFNDNGGSGSPASQTKTHGTDLKLSSTKPTRSGYSFVGWNTRSDGSGTSYKAGSTYKKNAAVTLYAQWSKTISACGKPSSLQAAVEDNAVTFSCIVGSNGTGSRSTGVEVFITCNGTTPDANNFDYRLELEGTAGTKVTHTLDLSKVSQQKIMSYFGNTYIGSVKFVAKTLSATSVTYDSVLTSAISCTLSWHKKLKGPEIIEPSLYGDTCGLLTPYRVSWAASSNGINNNVTGYSLRLFDATTETDVATFETTNLFFDIPISNFTAEHTYIIYVKAIGTYTNFSSSETRSGPVLFKNIAKFSNTAGSLLVSDGNTVPSTNILGQVLYPNIGSGTICKLSWDTPVSENNLVDRYELDITTIFKDGAFFETIDLGNVNEFYIKESMVHSYDKVKLDVVLKAISKYGNTYSNTLDSTSISIAKCAGVYTKVSENYPEPIMKRAIALAQVFNEDEDSGLLTDVNDLYLTDTNDISLAVHEYVWVPMQKFYKKQVDGTWQQSTVKYEVLVNNNGEIVTDKNDEIIYTL